MIHRCWLVAACIIAFDVRESSATKESYELLWYPYPNTYDLPRGLTLGNHSPSPSSAAVELSGRRVLPFLDPSASPVGAAFLFLSPPISGGASSSSSSSSGEECTAESSNGESEDAEAVSSHGDRGKHEEMPPPRTGEEKKRKAAS